jgi:DNA-binding transcriptional MerR regulator
MLRDCYFPAVEKSIWSGRCSFGESHGSSKWKSSQRRTHLALALTFVHGLPLQGEQIHVGRVALHECLTCGHPCPPLLAKPKSIAMSMGHPPVPRTTARIGYCGSATGCSHRLAANSQCNHSPVRGFLLDSGHDSRVYPFYVAETVHIGKAAKLGGVSVDTIRFYQKLGIIKSASRSAGGYRLFNREQIHELKFVRHAQELGFSLTEVKELLALRQKYHACSAVQSMLKRKLEDVREKIVSLARLEGELAGALRDCNRELRLKREIKHEDCCPLLTKLDRMNGSNDNKYVSRRRNSADE